MKALNLNKAKIFDYFILVIRFLLAYTFIRYGYSKLTDGQFGLNENELLQPIKDLNLMKVGWYLFSFQPFSYFIGVSQILCAIFLLFNRTVLLGALLFLPIAANILIIDLTIMPKQMANAFAFRLSFYILLDLLIFYHYREKVINAFKSLTSGIKFKFKHHFSLYLLLPLFALVLEFSSAIPTAIFIFLKEPQKSWNYITSIVNVLLKNI
ncbi:DoxX family membrane protein [Chryseobacterium sp. ISL-6]|uniref:DoxX family membrane protein n=1 Tax=Chryseobacterium sp. ISL-6 TaxID=2819143 RepID=UPI001BEA3E0C|nr:DoxX family membrane protein [Chryseobacterium sp. ISL-6]MBT2622206.1 DoxX family membrane protein [Chryseobacterium sp. ISL-6]